MKYVGLVDCNNFFVSCERVFRPDLNTKPVVVLSSNDGCVVARSQEIKDKGIPMGVPYFQVKDILKDMKAEVFSSHFSLYRDISRRVFEVVTELVGTMEQYSIDECFFLVEFDQAIELARKIKQEVWKQVGIPVSVGLASSKTRAKQASKLAKRTDGVCLLSDTDWKDLEGELSLAEIWGVGLARFRQFSSHGIRTVHNLTSASPETIGRLFGLEGVRLQAELAGKALNGIRHSRPKQKSLMSTRSFAEATNDFALLRDAVSYHVQQLASDLHSLDALATSIRVLIYPSRHGDFVLQGSSVEAYFTLPTKDIFELEREAMKLLETGFKAGVPYKKAGVVLANLVSPEAVSLSLFATEQKTNAISETILSLNNRYGKSLLEVGRMPEGKKSWQARNDSVSADYTTDWKSLRKVKA